MQLRKNISVLLLAVYLASTCGYAATILLCRCNRSRHCEVCRCECCCSASGHTHCRGAAVTASGRCCNHLHSTEIYLYDISKQSRICVGCAAACLPALPADEAALQPALPAQRVCRHDKIPMPGSPLAECRTLRAPPVSA